MPRQAGSWLSCHTLYVKINPAVFTVLSSIALVLLTVISAYLLGYVAWYVSVHKIPVPGFVFYLTLLLLAVAPGGFLIAKSKMQDYWPFFCVFPGIVASVFLGHVTYFGTMVALSK